MSALRSLGLFLLGALVAGSCALVCGARAHQHDPPKTCDEWCEDARCKCWEGCPGGAGNRDQNCTDACNQRKDKCTDRCRKPEET